MVSNTTKKIIKVSLLIFVILLVVGIIGFTITSKQPKIEQNQTNQTENPPDTNVTPIEGGSSGGTYKEDEQKQITISYSKEELTRQILSILIGVLVFIGLIILLVYLIIKVIR